MSRLILFLCDGNTCRSPMAEALLRSKLKQDNLDERILVRSAGIAARDGEPASPYAVLALERRGLDIRSHRSHALRQSDLDRADLVLVMTREQEKAIGQRYRIHQGQVRLLSEMGGQAQDIGDPYGGSLSAYEDCAEEIARLIDKGYGRILREVQEGA